MSLAFANYIWWTSPLWGVSIMVILGWLWEKGGQND
jgi:hypothetical protein